MGTICSSSPAEIIKVARSIMHQFYGKSLIGQALEALTASSSCPEPKRCEVPAEYLKCTFLSTQKEVWQYMVISWLLLAGFLITFIFKLCKSCVIRINSFNQTLTNNISTAMELTQASRSPRSPSATRRYRVLAREEQPLYRSSRSRRSRSRPSGSRPSSPKPPSSRPSSNTRIDIPACVDRTAEWAVSAEDSARSSD